MTADRLRQAATLLRGLAEAATPGPWPISMGTGYMFGRDIGSEIGKVRRPSDATYITTLDPPVALVLADWLGFLATARSQGLPVAFENQADAVADAILGDA